MMHAARRFLIFTAIAGTIFLLNGLSNVYLMSARDGMTDTAAAILHHLDDALFALLFAVISLLLAGFYITLRRELGYLYLALFAGASALMLIFDWDEKSILFGGPPNTDYYTLFIKSLLSYLLSALLVHVYGTGFRRMNLTLKRISLLFFLVTASAYLWGAPLRFNYQLFLLLTSIFLLANVILIVYLITAFRDDPERAWPAGGLLLFLVIITPDIGKDLLQDVLGVPVDLGQGLPGQSFEDTFPWGLLVLLLTFIGLFLKRFSLTLASKEQEIQTRNQMDSLVTRLSRCYKREQLEEQLLREGQVAFPDYRFILICYDNSTGEAQMKNGALPKEQLQRIVEVLSSESGAQGSGTLLELPGMVLAASGKAGALAFYMGLISHKPILLNEREAFTLQLMAKYAALFYEYLHMLDDKLVEIENNGEPWKSKLFMRLSEKERRRLASDLHDGVLQEVLQLRRYTEHGTGQEREFIRLGLENLEFMLRETCSELMPSFISEHGVLPAIRQLVEKTRLRADFELDYRQEPITAELTDEQMITVYRIVQELISNAVKHSEAYKVVIRLGQAEGHIMIDYADDGKGMDSSATVEAERASTEPLGLAGIRERVRILAGQFTLASAPGKGTRVHCRIPAGWQAGRSFPV